MSCATFKVCYLLSLALQREQMVKFFFCASVRVIALAAECLMYWQSLCVWYFFPEGVTYTGGAGW